MIANQLNSLKLNKHWETRTLLNTNIFNNSSRNCLYFDFRILVHFPSYNKEIRLKITFGRISFLQCTPTCQWGSTNLFLCYKKRLSTNIRVECFLVQLLEKFYISFSGLQYYSGVIFTVFISSNCWKMSSKSRKSKKV